MERVDADLVPFAQNNPSGYRFAFGTDTATDDINANYNDNIKKGWGTTPNEFPEVEDFNAFAYTSGYLTAYLYQMGIAEWNDKQKYKKYSRVIGSDGKIYKAKTGTDLSPNVDNDPTTDTTNWEDVLDNYASKTENQTIAGVKTFTSSPIVPTPTIGDQAANKQYADLKVALADFTGANVNLASSGYQKLPSGLIIQWGEIPAGTPDGADVNLPIAFPNQNFKVIATPIASLSGTQAISCYWDRTASTLSSLRIPRRHINTGGAVIAANEGASYIAIGY